ncbi:MAG: GGDEF domain-containing protein [Spirochaetota bacterium]|nr:GGDEF domain-containing protein [Spirochaetota bacterium]
MINIVDFLHQVDIFSLLSTNEIHQIIKSLRFINIDKEEILFNEGDEGNELFIVKSGKIASYVVLPNGNRREIAEFTQGDFFGEMSIFENASRSATCYSKEKSLLISLHERNFFELILYYPEIAIKIMYRMLNITAERLQEKSKFLSDMVQWGEKARKRAITDDLTGIYNRRYLDYALNDIFDKAKSSNSPLSMIMLDIDHLKKICDRYAQEQVNEIILEVVNVIKKYLREKDIFARYGGDEFTILLPDTNLDKARIIGENICRAVEVIMLPDHSENNGIENVTVSQGIASYPEDVQDINELSKAADQSLYEAKREGRNCVICYSNNLAL